MCYTADKVHGSTGVKVFISDCFGVGFDWKDEALKKAVENKDERLWEILEWIALGGAEKCNKAEQFCSNLSYESWEHRYHCIKEADRSGKLSEICDNEYLLDFGKHMIQMYFDGSMKAEVEKEKTKYDKPKRNGTSGYVYLIRAENGLYKIGKAKNVTTRLQPFSVHFPMKWELVHSFKADDYSVAEAELHVAYADKRDVGEWFKLAPEDVEYISGIQDGQL